MKIALYARVSTEKQEQQETIQSQLAALRSYANTKNYEIVGEYVDEGYSGELLARPNLDKLRDDAKKGVFEAVLIHSPDRLSRKFIYSGLVQEELKKQNITVIFLNRPDSKDTPEENLLNGMQGLIAEFEKEKIRERTRRGRLHRAQTGILVGSRPPYGYRYVKSDRNKNIAGHYEVFPQEAEVVRLIFDLFVNRLLTIRALAKELTRRGILPQRGKHWRTSSLNRILRNETYTGTTYYNKNISVEPVTSKNKGYRRSKLTSRRLRDKSLWVPIRLSDDLKIIDQETFRRAQLQLKRNSEQSSRAAKHQYLLQGLVKCGSCESPVHGVSYHGKHYYRCGNRHRTFPLPQVCRMSTVRAEKLERLVWDKLCEAIRNPNLISDQLKRLESVNKRTFENLSKDISDLGKQIADIGLSENRLLEAYTNGVVTLDQLKEQMDKIRAKRGKLEEARAGLQSHGESEQSKADIQKSIQDHCIQVEKRLKVIENDFEGRRHLLRLALNKVIFEKDRIRIKGIIPVSPSNNSAQECSLASTSSGNYDRQLQQSPVLS